MLKCALVFTVMASALAAPSLATAKLVPDFSLAAKPVPHSAEGNKVTVRVRVGNVRKWTATSVQACATIAPKVGKVVGVGRGGAIRFERQSACWIIRKIEPKRKASLSFDIALTAKAAKKKKLRIEATASGGNSNPASRQITLGVASPGTGKGGKGKRHPGKRGDSNQSRNRAVAAAAPSTCVSPRTLGVVFVTDDSGSMEISDPAHLRAQAIAVGLDQMPDGSLAAATAFADFSIELFGVTTVSASSRPGLKADAKSLYDEGNTDYDEAFAGAREQLGGMAAADRKAIVFLSDGIPTNANFDPDAPVDSAGVPVYTIGLGVEGSPESGSVLAHIAANSGGQFYDASSAGQLQAIFARVMATLTCGSQSVTESFKLAPGASKSIPFSVAPDDSEFRALATWTYGNVTVSAQRPGGTTMTPGTLQPGETFVNESTYSLLTGNTPLIGDWQLIVTANQGNLNDVDVSIDVFKKLLPLPPPPPPAPGRHLDPCITAYPSVQRTRSEIFGGHEERYDRTASLYAVCAGFGAPQDLNFSPEMKCALIAAAATFAGPPASIHADLACDTLSIAEAFRTGDWLGAAGGKACGYFGQALAGAGGVFIAGTTSASGPGAVAIGVRTYRFLAAGMKVTCGGLFAGGATAFGEKIEGDHQTNVALDITRKKLCLVYKQRFRTANWSAKPCS